MAGNLTHPTDADVGEFLAMAEPPGRREDAHVLLELFHRVTGEQPVMWGPSMVGYGRYRYRYATGREGDWFVVGFSPRKASMTLYGLQDPAVEPLFGRLGPHKLGAGCVYVGRLSGIDVAVLEELVRAAWERQGGSG